MDRLSILYGGKKAIIYLLVDVVALLHRNWTGGTKTSSKYVHLRWKKYETNGSLSVTRSTRQEEWRKGTINDITQCQSWKDRLLKHVLFFILCCKQLTLALDRAGWV
jgi:hypothetical protein